MDTAHVRYNCFWRFEPGPDTLAKNLLGGTSVVLSDLLHQQMNEIISFLVSTHMLTFQYVLLCFIWFMALRTLVQIHCIWQDLCLLVARI
jgi:hypothetical protein